MTVAGPDPTDAQLEELRAELHRANVVVDDWRPMRGDVSSRRYVRGRWGETRVVVAWYPPGMRATCARFLATGDLLRSVEVDVPAVLVADCSAGWTVLEDAGRHTLYDLRHRGAAFLRGWRSTAAEAARRIRRLDDAAVAALNPPLDGAALLAELGQTWETFLAPHRLVGSAAESTALWRGLEALCARLGEPPLVPCHRDFMARNLVPARRGLVVLDHQDLRLGPTWYDLASLLNDSLPADDDDEHRLRAMYEAGDLGFHRAAAQRSLKAIGTFCRFAQRGHPRHLPLVALSWRQAQRHLALLPELEEARRALGNAWSAFRASPQQLHGAAPVDLLD